MENLTEKVAAFQRSRDGLPQLVALLAPRVLEYPRRKLGWDEDACAEFYAFFQPRLERLLRRFIDQGKPFESYLCSVMSWQLKNFARERKRSERCWAVSLRLDPGPGLQEEGALEDECEPASVLPSPLQARVAGLLVSPSDKRNLLLLALKCLRSAPPERLSSIAAVAGMSPERLGGILAWLRGKSAPREMRLESFRVRRNRAYSQAILLETELREEVDPGRRADIQKRLCGARRRMRTAVARMSRVHCGPTNREIAEALGLPKGTVDSGLYWLKRKLAAVYDPVDRRLA
jgi:DNA-directed RNA polymerase specialized sigma24 family protein